MNLIASFFNDANESNQLGPMIVKTFEGRFSDLMSLTALVCEALYRAWSLTEHSVTELVGGKGKY